MRILATSALSVALGISTGCDSKEPTAPSTADATAGQAAPQKVDWATVKAADAMVTTEATCRLCRLLDVSQKGAGGPYTVRYAGGQAVDDSGASTSMSPEEWKGIMALLQKSPGGTSAGRALPAKANNYADGKGAARRHAYTFKRTDADTLTFTVVKPLQDESNG